QVGKVKWTPDHELACIETIPILSTIVRAEQCALFRLDHGVYDLWLRRCDGEGDSAIRLFRQTFAIALREFGPVLAAVGRFAHPATRAAGAEGPTLASEIPHGCVDGLSIRRTHRDHRATG